jgi:hypothetical protein
MDAMLPRTTGAPRWAVFDAENFLGIVHLMGIFPAHIYLGGEQQTQLALRSALRIVFQYLEHLSELLDANNFLAEKVGLHLLDLAPRLRMRGENEDGLTLEMIAVMFAWAKVFRDTPRCVAILRDLWDCLDEPERGYFAGVLLEALPGAAVDSNVGRIHPVLVRENLL